MDSYLEIHKLHVTKVRCWARNTRYHLHPRTAPNPWFFKSWLQLSHKNPLPPFVSCMRLLVHSGFFTEQQVIGGKCQQRKWVCAHSCFSSSPLKTTPLMQGHSCLKCLTPYYCNLGNITWALNWFQNDDDPTQGRSRGRRLNHFFNEAMASDSVLVGSAMVSKCKGVFEGLKFGVALEPLAKVIAKAFPHLEFYPTPYHIPYTYAIYTL